MTESVRYSEPTGAAADARWHLIELLKQCTKEAGGLPGHSSPLFNPPPSVTGTKNTWRKVQDPHQHVV